MQQSMRQILGTFLLVAVAAGAYYGLSYIDFFGAARITREEVERQTSEIEKDLIAQLNDLNEITLSGEVFENEAFKSLEDRTVKFEDVPIQRDNPFAPL